MSKKQKRILWPVLLIVALGLSAFAYASVRKGREPRTSEARSVRSQNPRALADANQGPYVRRGFIRPQLIRNLNAMGDRLEKAGKERLTIAGTFTRAGDAPGTFAAVFEFPDRLRLTIQNGLQPRVISFDGQEAKAVGGSLNAAEREIIETLVYDAADHFFTTQMLGQATRFLGARFRMDDGSAAKYSGPYYDIYQVGEQVKASADGRQQAKHYYFNSDTLLLERVRYEINRNGTEVRVENLIGNWQKEQEQQVPHRIERLENGRSVFVLTVTSVALSPRVDDGIF